MKIFVVEHNWACTWHATANHMHTVHCRELDLELIEAKK